MNNYYFFNLPQPLTKTDYQRVCHLVVEQLKNSPEVKSIYLSGGFWQPGISDIDILVVFYNQPVKDVDKFAPWDLPEKTKFFFAHTYGRYNQLFFENLAYLVTDINKNNLKLLYGKEILLHFPIKELNQDDYQLLNAFIIFDFLINKLLIYPRNLSSAKIDVRSRLSFLHSLIYTLEVVEKLNNRKLGQDFIFNIKQLRENWFNQPQEDNLKKLISLSDQGLEVILEIVAQLDVFTKRHSLIENKNIIFKNRRYCIVFDKNWHKEKFLENFKNNYISIRNPVSGRLIEHFKFVLPSSLSYFFMAYAGFDGLFSQWIRKGLKNYQQINLPLSQGMAKHVQLTNQLVKASIEQGGLFTPPFLYGYLLKKQRLISRLGDWLIFFLLLPKT